MGGIAAAFLELVWKDQKVPHGTHVFGNWLKLDPLFMIFGHFCNNKEEIKNMGDTTSLR